ncbi:MAG: trigger factor [Balneolales bacterium]
MNITVEDVSAVDKEIIVKADRKDLEPKFDKAMREYRKQMNIPGFRPGQVPVGLVRKRFGKEIEAEEINKYIQEIYTQEIVPKHQPVGEPQLDDFKWDNDELQVTFKIGVKPEFELTNLEEVTIDKMVHDVTEDEVDKEVENALERAAKWVETEEPIQENWRVTVDAMAVDAEGNPIEGDMDTDKELDLNDEQNEPFKKALAGKKIGEIAPVELGEGDDKATYNLTVKKILKQEKPELNDDFVKEATNGELDSVENFRSQIKSQIQNYFDESADGMAKQQLMEKLIETHEMEVPEVSIKAVQDFYVKRFKEEQGDNMPPDFNEEEYRENMKEKANEEAKWAFILPKLEEKYSDIELTAEDIDAELAKQAARYGLTTEMIKNFYAQSGEQMENLRQSIRTEKLFGKLFEEIKVNELDKEAYNIKHS